MILNCGKYDHCFGDSPQSSVLWNKMFRKFSLFLKTLWMKTSYDWKCPKSWSFYDYTYYDAYFKVMCVLQRTRFSSSLSVHKTGAHQPSTAMFQWTCMWWEHRMLHLCLNAKMTSSLFQKILLQVSHLNCWFILSFFNSGSIVYEDISVVKCDAVSGSSMWVYKPSHAWRQQSFDIWMIVE